ncbi:MAG: hypothetical protein L0Y56_13275 [Nitrospira sp.]|nr:hypothetical protein [Nitrospira sp.]
METKKLAMVKHWWSAAWLITLSLSWVLWVWTKDGDGIIIHIHDYATEEACEADYKKFFEPFPHQCLPEGQRPEGL